MEFMAVYPNVRLKFEPDYWGYDFSSEYKAASMAIDQKIYASGKISISDVTTTGARYPISSHLTLESDVSLYAGEPLSIEEPYVALAPTILNSREKVQLHSGWVHLFDNDETRKPEFSVALYIPSKCFEDVKTRVLSGANLPTAIHATAAASTLTTNFSGVDWNLSGAKYLFVTQYSLHFPVINSVISSS